MTWLIEETNYQNDFNVAQRLIYLCQERGLRYHSFKYIPFEGTDYSFLKELEAPVVFYGGFNALEDMRNRVESLPSPLAWADLDLFKCSTYYKKLAPYIFQQKHEFITLGDFISLENRIDWPEVFVRPDDNDKIFTGQVVERHFWKTFPRNLIEYKYVPVDLSVVISPAQNIDAEWRFVIVNGEVVAGSQYKDGKTIDIRAEYPTGAARFAGKVAKVWSPHPVFILDVCLAKGQYWVMEIGPFNYAGLYKCDLGKVVDAIESLSY